MTEPEKKDETMDPFTAMSVEIEKLKTDVASSRKALEDSNRNMVQMMNTNKNLVAEISAFKTNNVQAQPPSKSIEEVAFDALKRNLNIGKV